ncbi:hypothetical protein Tco_1027049 [Tanacetum coccineum]
MNKEPTRRTVPVEETTLNAVVSQCDGFGYDWSDQAKEGPTNFALMAYSSTSSNSSTNSEVSNDLNCCSSCLESVKDLKEQNEQLVKDLRTARISVVSYKTGLEYVEARLLVFKKNKSVYEEDIKLLKREIYLRDLDITELKRKLDLATKEKDEIMDKCKTGLGYNAVPPPYTGNFMPQKSDLVYPSLDDFVDVNESVSEPIVEKPTVETNEPKTARKENRAPIIEEWVSDSDEENVPKVKTVKMFNKPSFAKINFVKSTEQVKSPRKTSVDKNRQNTPSPKGNKRNWNQHMSQKLGSNFEMFNKACHVCGSFEHLRKDCNNWYNNQRFEKPVWINEIRLMYARTKACDDAGKTLEWETYSAKDNILLPLWTQDLPFFLVQSRGYKYNRAELFIIRRTQKGSQALKDPSGIEAMQEELLHSSYKKPMPQFKGLCGVSMDVKSAFLIVRLKRKTMCVKPPGFEDPNFPDRVYKVEKAFKD